MTGLDGDGGDGGDGTSVRPQAMGSVCRLLKVSVCSCVHTVSSCPVISNVKPLKQPQCWHRKQVVGRRLNVWEKCHPHKGRHCVCLVRAHTYTGGDFSGNGNYTQKQCASCP